MTTRGRQRFARVVAGLGVGFVFILFAPRIFPPIEGEPLDASPAEPAAGAPDEAVERRSIPGGPLLYRGEVLQLRASELPTDEPLLLHLDVPALPGEDGVLPARLLNVEQGPRDLIAAVGEERTHASVSVETSRLAPGRYVVELRTPERSHFPLRRYVFEVTPD